MMKPKKRKGRRCWLCGGKLPRSGYRRAPFYANPDWDSYDTKMRDVHHACLDRAPEDPR